MSTPIPQISKHATDDELQHRMQNMIDLQNEGLKLSQHELKECDTFHQTVHSNPPETLNAQRQGANSILTKGTGLVKMSRAAGTESLYDLQEATDTRPPLKMESTMNEKGSIGSSDIFSSDNDQGVGQGTLYLNPEKLGSNAAPYRHSSSYDDPNQSLTSEERRFMTLFSGNQAEQSGNFSYGAVKSSSPPPPPPHNSEYDYHSHPRHHQNQHQFYYGNPDYQHYHHKSPAKGGHRRQLRQGTILSAISTCGSCLLKAFYLCFCCCSTDAIEQQQLHRSFCYGAIDGMLTGSGIVAAFCGMNLLAPTSLLAVRIFVVAFSAAACFADSLCMALGHVWTTYVLVSATARERTEQRVAMESNKADAKGKLVDMLLERGMLKIDAMSLADTLEGYPDMFISALVGDALVVGGVGGNHEGSSDVNARHRNISSSAGVWGGGSGGGAAAAAAAAAVGSWSTTDEYPRYRGEADGSGGDGFLSWKFPSYSQKMHELETELNPEVAFMDAAMTESRREGMFMMLGFSIFAVVPSLIYLIIPMMINADHIKRYTSGSDNDIRPGGGISVTSIVITTTAVIMWCLGIWKSQFLDSNWLLFGIETVVVLLVCVTAAYTVGALLAHIMPEIDASNLFYTGTNVTKRL